MLRLAVILSLCVCCISVRKWTRWLWIHSVRSVGLCSMGIIFHVLLTPCNSVKINDLWWFGIKHTVCPYTGGVCVHVCTARSWMHWHFLHRHASRAQPWFIQKPLLLPLTAGKHTKLYNPTHMGSIIHWLPAPGQERNALSWRILLL